ELYIREEDGLHQRDRKLVTSSYWVVSLPVKDSAWKHSFDTHEMKTYSSLSLIACVCRKIHDHPKSALNICLAEICFPIFRVSRDCNLLHLMRSCNDVFTKPKQGGISPYELHYLVCKQVMLHCPTHFYSFIIASSSQTPLILW
ncbi:unnamed protein product, partial [Brassica oleracea var. botrytis]